MTDSRTQTSLGADPSQLGQWLGICVVWALINAGAMWFGTSPVLDGEMIGTDGYMRLVRVDLLYQTGAWFDGSIPRSNAPYGEVLHWTRPLDVLLLAGASILTPVLGFDSALFWVGAFLSPVLLLVAGFLMVWASKPLIDAELRPYVMLAFLIQNAVLAYSLPGRVDHHTLLFLVFVINLGLTLRLVTRECDGRLAALAGAVAGLGLWISTEFLIPVALTGAVLWLTWLREGNTRTRLNAGYAAGLAGAVAVALVVERPFSDLLAEEYDRLSVVYLVVALIDLGFWAIVWLGERRIGFSARMIGRLMITVIGGLAGAAVLYVTYPKFFGGPMVDIDLDPALIRVWVDKVKELQSVVPTDTKSFGQFLYWLGPTLVCLPFVLALVWTRRREETWGGWVYLALGLGVYTVLTLRHVRFAPYAEIVAVVVLIFLIGRVRQWLGRVGNETLRNATRGIASGVLLMGFTIVGGVIGYRTTLEAGVAEAARCEIRSVVPFLNDPEGLGGRSRIIATHIDYGPELLYRTDHSIIAGPYHRNAKGILSVYRIFSAGDEAQSKALIDTRRVDFLLLCTSSKERFFYANQAAEMTFYAWLLENRYPAWLRPVPLPAGLDTDFRLFEVVR